MGLAEKLASRVSARGATAQVDCGELGSVTVEAIPLRELELLYRGPDGARKVFYAACRELQAAGEQMRREGKLYTPDAILQFVADSEAETAAEVILDLSGATKQEQVGTESKDYGTNQEFRLASVQNTEPVIPSMEQNRLAPVQNTEPVIPSMEQNRLAPVQENDETASDSGQVSRETKAEIAGFPKVPDSDNKTPSVGEFLPDEAQNVVPEENIVEDSGGVLGGTATGLHETKSESTGALHEMKSDFGTNARLGLHETESEFGGRLHETESELRGKGRSSLHDIESDSGRSLHETESESPEMLHETESELAERTARCLLEGLQRAKWVRGG